MVGCTSLTVHRGGGLTPDRIPSRSDAGTDGDKMEQGTGQAIICGRASNAFLPK
jgi:hypothetical protein